MRVEIRHRTETKGILKQRAYCVVDVQFQFSEEEKHIVNQWGLDQLIVERGIPADRDRSKYDSRAAAAVFNLTLARVLDGKLDSFAFDWPIEANNYHRELVENLPKLKKFIMANAGIETKSETIEL